jgi:hypothetical protein
MIDAGEKKEQHRVSRISVDLIRRPSNAVRTSSVQRLHFLRDHKERMKRKEKEQLRDEETNEQEQRTGRKETTFNIYWRDFDPYENRITNSEKLRGTQRITYSFKFVVQTETRKRR